MPVSNPVTNDPVLSARGRLAYASRLDSRGDTSKRDAARLALSEALLERHIREVLAIVPPLSADQRDRLASILRPSRSGGTQS